MLLSKNKQENYLDTHAHTRANSAHGERKILVFELKSWIFPLIVRVFNDFPSTITSSATLTRRRGSREVEEHRSSRYSRRR